MEGKSNIGPEGGYLRRVLSDCLTDAVVELVQKRPADPIDFLAHHLYKYRSLHPLTKEEVKTQQNEAKPESQQQKSVDVKQRLDLKVTTENDNFRMENDLYEGPDIGKAIVHTSYVPMFDGIGDIFDDDDVT